MLRAQQAPASEPWSTVVHDPRIGPISLRGHLAHIDGSSTCVIIVHGLGGNADAVYCIRAAQAAQRAGLSSLRLCMRGADDSGQDIYHAGLTADIEAALASPELQRYRNLLVIGYSLGGHIGVRFALSPSDTRVKAVAAVCPPLDLGLTAEAMNRPEAKVYQYLILQGLKLMYEQFAKSTPAPSPVQDVLAVRSLREWDALTVAPRFGFQSAEDYYYRMSAGPALPNLEVPTLLVISDHDPMIPPWTHGDFLRRDLKRVAVRKLKSGGHVGFPARHALEDETVGWLLAHVGR